MAKDSIVVFFAELLGSLNECVEEREAAVVLVNGVGLVGTAEDPFLWLFVHAE